MNLAEALTFPDVEALLVGALRAVLDAPVYVTIPNPRPATFVRVVRSGGPSVGVVDDALVTVEAWAPSTVAAAALARTVRAQLSALAYARLATGDVIRVREAGGPANDPDPTSGSPRYSWTVEVRTRGGL